MRKFLIAIAILIYTITIGCNSQQVVKQIIDVKDKHYLGISKDQDELQLLTLGRLQKETLHSRISDAQRAIVIEKKDASIVLLELEETILKDITEWDDINQKLAGLQIEKEKNFTLSILERSYIAGQTSIIDIAVKSIIPQDKDKEEKNNGSDKPVQSN